MKAENTLIVGLVTLRFTKVSQYHLDSDLEMSLSKQTIESSISGECSDYHAIYLAGPPIITTAL